MTDYLNEALIAGVHICALAGTWLLGSKKRVGWLLVLASGGFAIVLNFRLGLVLGVAFAAISIVAKVRGWIAWREVRGENAETFRAEPGFAGGGPRPHENPPRVAKTTFTRVR